MQYMWDIQGFFETPKITLLLGYLACTDPTIFSF